MKTQLKFKGSRNYLHSTDFYTWFSTAVCEENQIVTKLVFKQLIHRQCEVLFGQLEDDVEKNIVGTVELLDKNTQERTRGVIVETEEEVQESYPFDEDILVQRADVISDEQQAFSFFRNDCTTVELVVALTKKLHNTLFSLKTGKWLVGQLNFFDELPIVYESLSIKTTRIMQNKFSINDVVIDEKRFGTVQFIVGE